jgi:phosphoglycerate dehydrogenase-like enzyme
MMPAVVEFLETVHPVALDHPQLLTLGYQLPGSESDRTRVRALVLRGGVQLDKKLLDSYPKLEVVARCGVGVNNIDVEHCTERGIQVLNAPGVNAATVAEHTIGLMLLLVRGMYRLLREVKEGNWDYRQTYAGQELRGLRLGIIGPGDIGKRTGAVAGAMGMTVNYVGRDAQERQRILTESEVVSLHLPLTARTHHLIDGTAFGSMREGAYLINTARGEIVEPRALDAALESGKLAGYASDLMVGGDDSLQQRLIARPNVLITPHAASLTALTFREMSELTVSNVVRYLKGESISHTNRVNDTN